MFAQLSFLRAEKMQGSANIEGIGSVNGAFCVLGARLTLTFPFTDVSRFYVFAHFVTPFCGVPRVADVPLRVY